MQEMREALIRQGYFELPSLLDRAGASGLLDAVMATRKFDASLFLTEAEWEASPKTHKHTNPGPGYNLLEKIPEKTDFVEKANDVQAMLSRLLGPSYRILSKKLICRLSWDVVPDWLQRYTRGKPSNTYGAFIKPQFRDISYFLDVDMHQDIQDRARFAEGQREHRYMVLYVYLDKVTENEAPVNLLPGSHVFGATPYQHDVRYVDATDTWRYQVPSGGVVENKMKILTGDTGHAGLWHPNLIHGSTPVKSGHMRVSLRYLIGRGRDDGPCMLDDINSTIQGPLFLDQDFTPGANANYDGTWNLRMTDFIRKGYETAHIS